MLDAVGEYLEERVLPGPVHRPSAGSVVGAVTLAFWGVVGGILFFEML
jgi:hypothetical protein